MPVKRAPLKETGNNLVGGHEVEKDASIGVLIHLTTFIKQYWISQK